MVKEIDAPFQGTAYWFLESKWSEWKPYFLLWPRKWNGRWRWLEWVERRASEFTIQYRPTTPNAELRGDGPASPARRPSSNDGLGAAAPERN